jgi:hypothetical protein
MIRSAAAKIFESKSLILLSAFALLTACKQEQAGNDALNTIVDGGSNQAANKIMLDQATYDQVALYVGECQGHKQCVQICHRPPGNPDNSKTMVLPLKASIAHLNHGGPHEDGDYLGACQTPDGGGGGGTDTGGGGGGTDGGGGGGGGTVTPDVPLWCQPYHDIDTDCDGIIDSTGEPIF